MSNLLNRVKNKTAKVVVVGIGYVGLPVVALCAKAGFESTGVDVNESRIALLKKGGNPIEGREPGLDDLLKQANRTGQLHFTSSPAVYRDADIIIIAVETPVEKDHRPRYKALHAAIAAIASGLKNRKTEKQKNDEVMVIVESTIAPGTIDGIVRPTLERLTGRKEGKGLYVVNCPERLMPGQLIKKIKHHSRVIGAASAKSASIAKTFYRNIIVYQPKHLDFQWRGELDVASNIEAEIVKTAENAYRDVQIAFANELAWLCQEYGANFWEVRELIRKSPHRDVHEAGAGVGGHCIPKDSWLLLANARSQHQHSVIAGARQLNDDAPKQIINLIKHAAHSNNLPLNKIKLALMGFSYLADSDDTRNSPTEVLIKSLDRAGVKYKTHDPFVAQFNKQKASQVIENSNIAVFMVAHSEYRDLKLVSIAKKMKAPKIIIDGRNIFNLRDAERAGLNYFGIGNINKISK